MPIFEYICTDCGQTFEALVLSTNKNTELDCPACHSENIMKQISSFSSKFSGGSQFSYGSSSGIGCSTGSV